MTDKGNVYTGVCIDTSCSIGFCAERNVLGQMITAGESQIKKIVAVDWDGSVIAHCGVCREFIFQVHPDNYKTEVILKNGIKTIAELLPDHWAAGKVE